MKKILKIKVRESYALKKILRIMRISIILLLIGIANVYAKTSYAQNAKVTINPSKPQIRRILKGTH